jgi:tetratricopeptide (TPR) repeat protein
VTGPGHPDPGPATNRPAAATGDPCKHPVVASDPIDSDEPLEPESAYDLLQRGTALLAARHHAQAAVVLERAARLEPGKGSILEALGRAYYNSAQHERAFETFTALLEVDPSSAYGHFALGQSLRKLGRVPEARTHLRLAVALSPASELYRGALARLPETDPPPAS